MASPEPQKLTIGIEFEFLVAQKNGEIPPDDTRWMVTDANKTWTNRPAEVVKEHIILLLEDTAPIYASNLIGPSPTYLRRKLAKLNVVSLTEFPEYAMWQITTDESLAPIAREDPAGYDFSRTKMELISRVLQEDEFDEVARVYCAVRADMRIHVNSSCGLHVHVGIAHLATLEIKKLLTLLMCFEPFFFNIVAPHRIANPYSCPATTKSIAAADASDAYYEYLSDEDEDEDEEHPRGRNDENAEMAAWLPPTGLPALLLPTLRRVWNAHTLTRLRHEISADATRGGRASCIRLRGDHMSTDIDGARRPSDMTLEFRHREASGRPVVDRAWVGLCVALVRCARLPRGEFVALLAAVGSAEPLDFGAFLGVVGLGAAVGFWRAVRDGYEAGVANPPLPALLSALRDVNDDSGVGMGEDSVMRND